MSNLSTIPNISTRIKPIDMPIKAIKGAKTKYDARRRNTKSSCCLNVLIKFTVAKKSKSPVARTQKKVKNSHLRGTPSIALS